MKNKKLTKFGQYIRKNKISNLRVYDLTGIDPSVVSRLVTGQQKPFPSWKKRISIALNVEPSVIFPESEDER